MTTPADLAAARLATLFDLPALDIKILGADTFGSGSRAAVEIQLSNGETMTFETLREMGNAGILAAELAACTGALPKLAKSQALEAISLVREIARAHRTISDNDTAREWGQSYLEDAEILDVDLGNQADRWATFSALKELGEPSNDPFGVPVPKMVLRHTDGTLLVRASWFSAHVRRQDSISTSSIPIRMSRAGWHRRGSEGRIKATRPGFRDTLQWSFYLVPADWQNGAGNEVTAGQVLNARAQHDDSSRVGAVTRRDPVTASEVAA